MRHGRKHARTWRAGRGPRGPSTAYDRAGDGVRSTAFAKDASAFGLKAQGYAERWAAAHAGEDKDNKVEKLRARILGMGKKKT